jgi:hypothetical protein
MACRGSAVRVRLAPLNKHRPLLAGLNQGFRRPFSMLGEVTTIAVRIDQKCHYDCLEAFLMSHREVRSAEQHQAAA